MADQGFPPVPPVPPEVPHVGEPQQTPQQTPYAPGNVPEQGQPPRRSRAWMWWTLGVLALVAITVASCTLPFAVLFWSDGPGDATFGGDAIAVIRIDGIIAGTGDYYAGYITPEHFLDQLEQAVEDESVKAIVLRVDSPGGTVAASEEISEYVRTCKKPVIVSIGDVGASGAYMISSQADEIWANQGSSVGSIGVISEIPNASDLLEKVGVEFQVITAGENKDTGSPYRPLTKQERALIQGEVDEAYVQFIDIVARGRKLKTADVEKLATGWTWSGTRAKDLKLIDRVGTYKQALDAAAKKGGIEGDYEVVQYESDFGSLFGPLLGIEQSLQKLSGQTDATRESAVRRAVPR